MKKYTWEEQTELIQYLWHCVKEGWFDQGEAEELIRTKNFAAMDELREKGDMAANDNEREDCNAISDKYMCYEDPN